VTSAANREDSPRVLLIGPLLPSGRNVDPDLSYSTSLSASPTLHDFGVIVCRYSNAQFQRTSTAKWAEWSRFLSAGGTAFIIGIEPSLQRHVEKLSHLALTFERESGEELSWTQGPAIFPAVMRRRCSRWSVALPRQHEKDVTVLARNNAGSAVAFQVPVGPGLFVALPSFDGSERRKLIRALIQFGEDRSRQLRHVRRLPPWAVSFPLESEARLVAERESIDNRLLFLTRAKALLVETGPDLSKACYLVLQDILGPEGFTVAWTERGGAHDLELTSGTLTIIAEVRGCAGPADVEFARQLMHHIDAFRPSTSRVKGLLIANAYRDLPLDQRPEPFTAACLRLAEQRGYCVVTTGQLLETYDRIKTRKFSAAEFVELVRSTSGRMPPVSSGTLHSG
jgi:hypothetical protein